MRLIHVLNLAAGASCLIVSVFILLYGSVVIVEPNPFIVVAEAVLAFTTITLNVREVIMLE